MLNETKLMQNAEERDIDTTNDTEDTTTYEQDTTESSETTEAPDTTPETDENVTVAKSELDKLRREAAAAKRLREKTSRESGEKGGEKSDTPEYDKELIERTFLAAQAGINDPDVQDEAIRLARKFDMNITQAIKDEDIKTRLANLQKQMQAKKAVAKDSAGASAQNKGMDYWVAKFKKDGTLPTDQKILAKMMEHLD
jgi:hypothetical protein